MIIAKRKILFLAVISFFINASGHASDSKLKIEVKPAKMLVKNGQEISIDTIIENVGKEVQRLEVWSCSYYDNWNVDSPFVKLQGWACRKNGVIEVALKPKEKYEKELRLKINVPAEEIQVEKITFKLGFKASLNETSNPKEFPIIWSDPIILQIKE